MVLWRRLHFLSRRKVTAKKKKKLVPYFFAKLGLVTYTFRARQSAWIVGNCGFPGIIYLFKVNKGNTRKGCQ